MSRIVLDPTGSVPEQRGSTVVTTEVTFWQVALNQEPLHIRGKRLCAWAEAFYSARGTKIEEQRPPFELLRDLCPELSAAQAQSLATTLGERLSSLSRPLELQNVASELFGQPFLLNAPDRHRAERYLVWRLTLQPSEAEGVVLGALAREFQHSATPPEAQLYTVSSPAEALGALKTWLGWDAPREQRPPFSQELPLEVKRQLQNDLRQSVIKNPGHFERLRQNGADKLLLRLAAETTAEYYQTNPEGFDQARFSRLLPHLSPATREMLGTLLPVAEPLAVPSQTSELFDWFETSYMPYRTWPRHDEAVVARLARAFAETYLRLYAGALSGSADQAYLSWHKVNALKGRGVVTLLVVLDGLSFADALVFKDALTQLDTQERFVVVETTSAFGPLPSITRCSKPALETGLSPDRAAKQPTVGVKLTKDTDLARTLQAASPGDIVIWSLSEPDSTYHKDKDMETVRNKAHYALRSVAERLLTHTQTLGEAVPLEIIVSTDHGRLLGSSSRSQRVPQDMRAEGRAATGPSGQAFDETGFRIGDDLVYLGRERFRMEEDAAVVLSSDSFLTSDGKRGTDAYPHGGLYPEEVLVPWLVLTRNFTLQLPTARLSGSGEAQRTAELTLTVTNPNAMGLTLEALELNFLDNPVPLTLKAPPMREVSLPVAVVLPSSQIAETARARLSYASPNGSVQQVEVEVAISSLEMYASDNALEDLL